MNNEEMHAAELRRFLGLQLQKESMTVEELGRLFGVSTGEVRILLTRQGLTTGDARPSKKAEEMGCVRQSEEWDTLQIAILFNCLGYRPVASQ